MDKVPFFYYFLGKKMIKNSIHIFALMMKAALLITRSHIL